MVAKIKKEKKKNEEKNEKSKIEKELFLEKKNAWELLENEKKEAFALAKEYKKFIDENKTEREIVRTVESMAKKNGYVNLKDATPTTKKFMQLITKNILLVDLSGGNLKQGARIIGSHIDILRLDFKLNPIYESESFALINTHYYGGIKIPLVKHPTINSRSSI